MENTPESKGNGELGAYEAAMFIDLHKIIATHSANIEVLLHDIKLFKEENRDNKEAVDKRFEKQQEVVDRLINEVLGGEKGLISTVVKLSTITENQNKSIDTLWKVVLGSTGALYLTVVGWYLGKMFKVF